MGWKANRLDNNTVQYRKIHSIATSYCTLYR